MDLGSAVYEAMAGGAAGGEPAGFRDALNYLADGAISTSALARDLGVARSTLRGWLGGRTPRGARGDRIVEGAQLEWRRDVLSSSRERQMRSDWSTDSLVVVGTYTYDGKAGPRSADEDREVALGEYLNDVGENLVDAFLDGATPQELGDIVADAINDHGFYADSFGGGSGSWDVSEVRWL